MDLYSVQPKTLAEAIVYFSSPIYCREYMVSRRWPKGVTCPVCGSQKVYFDSSRNGWECKTRHPKRKFTLKTGTIFEDSPLGLDKWLPCVWMIANMKNGVSSHEIARSLGVTQKTAWFMLHRVRLAMQADHGSGKMNGTVEVDETFIGGKARNMHADRRAKHIKGTGPTSGKIAVMGLLQRDAEGGSKVRVSVVSNRRKTLLTRTVKRNVEAGATVYSDALKSYDSLHYSYYHQICDHAIRYVEGTVHTNGLENFWSLMKRNLHGTYIAVEPFHLFRYLDEQAFRFNNRKMMGDAERFNLALMGIYGRRIEYSELTGEGVETRSR